jgi:hypothetical protein
MENFTIYLDLTGYEIGWYDSLNTSISENALRLFCIEDEFGISHKCFAYSRPRACSSLCPYSETTLISYFKFFDLASRHKSLLITNLMQFFVYLFIQLISLHVSSIKCSSSGGRIVLIHYLVRLVCVSDCLVCRSGGKCSSLLTSIPSCHTD